MLVNSSIKNLKLSKVIQGRDKWRDRSNRNQAEKRKLQDKNRYLEQKIEKNIEKIKKLQEEFQEKKRLIEANGNQEKKLQILEKQLKETKDTLDELKKNRFSV